MVFDLVNIHSIFARRSIGAAGKVALVGFVVQVCDIQMFPHAVSVHKPLGATLKCTLHRLFPC